MGKDSHISWTNSTFNPWIGCAKVSAGCLNCYAEALMDTRYGRVEWGPSGTRSKTSASYWRQPISWNLQAYRSGVRRRVFCASLADVFEDRAELEPWRKELFNLISKTTHLDWLFLTKRPDFARHWLDYAFNGGRVAPNIWVGTSVENQEVAAFRIKELARIQARIRFLSIEPIIGRVDICEYLNIYWDSMKRQFVSTGMPCVDWIIVGGESKQSGRLARPSRLEWYESLIDQCRGAKIPIFIKQLGSCPLVRDSATFELSQLSLRHSKGEDMDEWPKHIRIREIPDG